METAAGSAPAAEAVRLLVVVENGGRRRLFHDLNRTSAVVTADIAFATASDCF